MPPGVNTQRGSRSPDAGDLERLVVDGVMAMAQRRRHDNACPGRSLAVRQVSEAFAWGVGFDGSFGVSGGVDPLAAGWLDPNDECAHGRLPGDRSEPCGCWGLERALLCPVDGRRGRRLGWTEEEVLAVLTGVLVELGCVPSRREWDRARRTPVASTIIRVCGSWADAVVACGGQRPVQGGRRGVVA